jgi:hypothetical protein
VFMNLIADGCMALLLLEHTACNGDSVVQVREKAFLVSIMLFFCSLFYYLVFFIIYIVFPFTILLLSYYL